MMRGTRGGYIRGGRGVTSYRGHSTSTYRGNSGGGGYNPNHNPYNRDHSAGAGIGGRYSGGGGGGIMNDNRGRGGYDNSFNSSSSSRYISPRYQGNNPQPENYIKRPYPASTHSSRDRSPDRKRNRSESSRRTDDYGPNNSSYNSGGGGGGNSYNNRYDGNNSSGFNPNRRYDSSSSRGSSAQTLHHRVAYRPSQAGDDHVSGRPTRNPNDRYEPPTHHHQPHHHNSHGGGGGGGGSSSSHHFSPPVRRPYVSRGGPSNRVSTTYTSYRGRGTTYGRGTSIRRPYGSTLHARSSTGYGVGAGHLSTTGGSSYVRRTAGASDPIRRKVMVPRLNTATDLARKLKIAKLRSTIRKNNEKKSVNAATVDGDVDSDTDAAPSKSTAKTEMNDDEEDEDGAPIKDDEEDEPSALDEIDQDEDADETDVEKKASPAKRPVRKVNVAKGRTRKPIVNDDEDDVDDDELQLDNDVEDDDIEADRDADEDNQPEYAVKKRPRTYIELNCVHCRRSYFTMKSYNFHLYGSQHKSALFQTAQRQKAQVARIRAQQRRAQRDLEDAHEDDGDADAPLLGEPQFCLVCRLNYRSDVTEHQQSMEHRQIKRILKPSCRVCQVGFNCPMDYEVHRTSLEHLKVEAELSTKKIRDSVDVNWGEFQTVDSIGDVDDAELVLKNAEDATMATADDGTEEDNGEQDDGDAAVEKPKKKPHKVAEPKEPANIGVEMIREIKVMFCDVCGTTLTQRTDPEVTLRNHCRWRTHIRLYNQHIQTEERREARKRKQQQLDKATAEKRKKTTAAGSETSGSTTKNGSAAASVASSAAVSGTVAATTDDNDVAVGSEKKTETAVSADPDVVANEAGGDDEDDDDVVDDKTWADVDKDLGELLQAVSSENANDDEDEDSTTNTERYDRFKNSEHEKNDGTTIAATDKGKVAANSDQSKKTTGTATADINATNVAEGSKTKTGNGVAAVI